VSEDLMKRALMGIGGAVAAATVFYGGYVAVTYLRFGRAACKAERNPLLDRLMPEYDVRERHSVTVSAPAEITLAAARDISFHDSPIVRAILARRALPGRLRGLPQHPSSGDPSLTR